MHTNFWKNKHRIEKFKELGIDHYNAQTIDIGLIAVLTDVKTPNFEEVVKQMMLGDNEKYFKAYSDWKWILVRTDGGKWQHVAHGY